MDGINAVITTSPAGVNQAAKFLSSFTVAMLSTFKQATKSRPLPSQPWRVRRGLALGLLGFGALVYQAGCTIDSLPESPTPRPFTKKEVAVDDTGGLKAGWHYRYDEQGRPTTKWYMKPNESGEKLVRHGSFIRYHQSGKTSLVGNYHQGTPVGVWRWYNEHGVLLRSVMQQGEYKQVVSGQELVNNETIFRTPHGIKTAEGIFKYNKPHGQWRYFYTDGAPRAEGRYLQGIPDGQWRYYYPNGQIKRIDHYELGIANGDFMEAYANGQEKTEGRIDQGLRTETWRSWYENGQLESQGLYVEDQRDGEWNFYNQDGELTGRIRYKAGEEAAKLPLPQAKLKALEVIPDPFGLPSRPRLYDENGAEIDRKESY